MLRILENATIEKLTPWPFFYDDLKDVLKGTKRGATIDFVLRRNYPSATQN
jgi:hypothetical protein